MDQWRGATCGSGARHGDGISSKSGEERVDTLDRNCVHCKQGKGVVAGFVLSITRSTVVPSEHENQTLCSGAAGLAAALHPRSGGNRSKGWWWCVLLDCVRGGVRLALAPGPLQGVAAVYVEQVKLALG